VSGGRFRGKPRTVSVDILLPKHRLAIFVHGCFWHRHSGCKNCTTPTNRRDWWLAKLNGNAARDQLHQRALRKLGWRTLVIWECEIEKPITLRVILRKLTRLLSRQFRTRMLSRCARA
jgi:DNA mismatch endonuclease (patch repair protein)